MPSHIPGKIKRLQKNREHRTMLSVLLIIRLFCHQIRQILPEGLSQIGTAQGVLDRRL